jgi:hypothetical protein
MTQDEAIRVLIAPDGQYEVSGEEDAVGVAGPTLGDVAAQLLALGFDPKRLLEPWQGMPNKYRSKRPLGSISIGAAAGVSGA